MCLYFINTLFKCVQEVFKTCSQLNQTDSRRHLEIRKMHNKHQQGQTEYRNILLRISSTLIKLAFDLLKQNNEQYSGTYKTVEY